MHVFIEAGLRHFIRLHHTPGTVRIFEMGFGTGLNALLSLIEAGVARQAVIYETVEAYPLEEKIYSSLNYCEQLQRPELLPVFQQMHTCTWNQLIELTPWFSFRKWNTPLAHFSIAQPAHLIYYDAFAPGAQPELWTEAVFQQLNGMMKPGGILTTYCSKGDVRRAMMAAGFTIEKIPGPPGKREMVRATKMHTGH